MVSKWSTPRHITIKMPKIKAVREKQIVTYKGAPIRLSADLSTETLQVRKDWQEIFIVMKRNDL